MTELENLLERIHRGAYSPGPRPWLNLPKAPAPLFGNKDMERQLREHHEAVEKCRALFFTEVSKWQDRRDELGRKLIDDAFTAAGIPGHPKKEAIHDLAIQIPDSSVDDDIVFQMQFVKAVNEIARLFDPMPVVP